MKTLVKASAKTSVKTKTEASAAGIVDQEIDKILRNSKEKARNAYLCIFDRQF